MSSKHKKIIIIMSIIIVAIIAIIIGILFLATDVFKSPQQLFYKYVGQNSKILEIFESESYELLNQKKKIAPYTSQGEISLQQTVQSEENADTENELFKIITEGKNDISNQKQYNNITLTQGDNSLFNMKYLRTGDKYALTSDEIVTAYVAVENNNLKELFIKMGMSEENLVNIPDRIEAQDILSILEFTEEEKEVILSKYYNLLVNSIPKDKFSKRSNVLDGGWEIKTYKAHVYTLTLTNIEIKNIATNIFTTLQSDDTTLNILLNKYNRIASNGMTLEKLKEIVENLIEELNNIQLEKTENININLYVNDGVLLKTEIVTSEYTLQIKYFTGQEKIIINLTPIDIETYETNFDNIEITKKETDNEYSLNVLFNNVTDTENNDSISIQISNAGNISSNNIRQLNKIQMNQDGQIFAITQSNNLTFETSVEIEELNDENSVTINNYTQQELTELITALQNRITQVFMEKMNLLVLNENANTDGSVEQNNENSTEENEQVEEPISEEQQAIDTFNEQFTPYLGEAVQGEKVKTLLGNVKTAVQNGNVIKVSFTGIYNNTSVQKQGATPEEIEEMIIYVIMSKNYFVEGLADTTGKLAELTIKENT